MVTSKEILSILTGTELGGRADDAYKASFADPKSIYGTSWINAAGIKCNSRISFVVVQLDIGSNLFAKSAYSEVLVSGDVTEVTVEQIVISAEAAQLFGLEMLPGADERERQKSTRRKAA